MVCVHNKPGVSSKGRRTGPVSWIQKFYMELWANRGKKKRHPAEMVEDIRELWK